jgi:hypothetical protein
LPSSWKKQFTTEGTEHTEKKQCVGISGTLTQWVKAIISKPLYFSVLSVFSVV